MLTLILKGLFFKTVGLLRHPVTWIVLLALSTVFCANGWKGQIATTKQVRAECVEQGEAAIRASLEAQAEAYAALFAAHQEAVVRMSVAEAQQAAAARFWKDKYAEALKTPACMKWSSEEIKCPVS